MSVLYGSFIKLPMMRLQQNELSFRSGNYLYISEVKRLIIYLLGIVL